MSSENENWDDLPCFEVPHLPRDDQERENIVAAYYAGREDVERSKHETTQADR